MEKLLLKIYGLFILLTFTLAGLAQKTDKVYLKNGDILTGEIKSLKFAQLKIDITGPGKIDIKYEEVIGIKSDKTFQVTLRKGQILITKIDSAFFKTQQVTLNDIVEIVRMKDRFLARFLGDVSLGFNYAKSSDIIQFNFGSTLTYRKPTAEITLKVNSVISSQSTDSLLSKKQDVTLDGLKQLKNNFFLQGLVAWQQNTELGLNNRYSIAAGGGKIPVVDNKQRLLTGAGLSFNLEQSSESSGYTQNLEGRAVIQFKRFHYSYPKMTIETQYVVYPGISDWGRVRMDLDVTLKYEFFKDFNVGLSFYDTYDNRPPSGASSNNDFGINFTIGYEFGK
jgi:hypothetical protein